MAKALLCRIRFRKLFHLGLERALKKTKQDLAQASKHFVALLGELESIRSTAKLAAKEVEGFDKGLDLVPSPGGPVRVSPTLTFEESLDFFEALFAELQMACSISTVAGYKDMKAYVLAFAKKSRNPLSRSLLHMQLDSRKGISLNEAPRWCPSRRMIADAVNLPHQTDAIGAEVDLFLDQCLIGVQNWCQCMCLNRSRQRRRLRKGLEDWKNLLDHAYAADNSPAFIHHIKDANWRWPPLLRQEEFPLVQGPLMTWIEQECCQSMILYLLMGCELDLYHSREYLMIFWYCEYLFSKVLSSIRELYNARPGAVLSPEPPPEKGKKANKRNKGKEQADLARTQKYAAELALLEVERQMCQGLIRLLLGINMMGAMANVQSIYNGEAERFHQRFLPFMQLDSPEPLDYQAYIAHTTPEGISADKVMEGAWKCFSSSQEHSQLILKRSSVSGLSESKLAEVEALKKVAKTNTVTASVLMSIVAASGETQMKAKFSFQSHSFYPVVSITRS